MVWRFARGKTSPAPQQPEMVYHAELSLEAMTLDFSRRHRDHFPCKISRWRSMYFLGTKEKIIIYGTRHNRMVRICGESLKRWLCVGKIQEVKSRVFFHKLKVWPNKNPFEIERSGFLGGTDLCCFAQVVGISLKAVFEWPKLTYIVDVKASKPWSISTIHQKWTKIMIFKSEKISKNI